MNRSTERLFELRTEDYSVRVWIVTTTPPDDESKIRTLGIEHQVKLLATHHPPLKPTDKLAELIADIDVKRITAVEVRSTCGGGWVIHQG